MRRITLKELAEEKGQTQAANLIGIRQSSLSKALRVGREVFVTEQDDGTWKGEEVRPFPSQLPKSAA